MTTGDGRHVVRWAAVVARLLLRVIAAGLAIGVVLMLAGFPDAGYVVLKVSLALLLCSPVLQVAAYVLSESQHGPRYAAAAFVVLALLVYQLISRFTM